MKDNNQVVTIELDRIRELWFGHKAMKRWAAYTGKSIQDIESAVTNPEEIESLMYFMLEKDALANGEKLEMDQMENLLDLAPIGEIYEKLSQAVMSAFPTSKSENEKNESGAAGTGKKA